MAEVINLQQVLDALAASGVEADTLLTAVGELSSVPAGGFNTPVNTLYTLQSANGTPLANVINISQQAASEAAQAGNSNIAGAAAGTFTNSQGASAAAGQTAGMTSFFGGAKKFLGQTVPGTEHFGVGTVAASVAAVAVGARLGKTFSSIVYNTGKLFGFDMADTLNPETWDSITYDMEDTGLEGVYKRGIQMLLGLNSDTGKVEAYMPRNTFDYLAYVLSSAGYFDRGGAQAIDYPTEGLTQTQITQLSKISMPFPFSQNMASFKWDGGSALNYYTEEIVEVVTGSAYGLCVVSNDSTTSIGLVSNAPFTATLTTKRYSKETGEIIYNRTTSASVTGSSFAGTSYKICLGSARDTSFIISTYPATATLNDTGNFSAYGNRYGYVLYNGTTQEQTAVEGVGDQTGATLPPIDSTTTQQGVSDAITNTYPEMSENYVEMPVAVPATVPKPVTYIQVPLPSTVAGNNPTVEPTATPQADPNIDPQTATDPLQALLLKLLTAKQAVNMPDPANDPEEYPEGKPEEPVNTNPADVGTGTTPPLVVPVGSASALWTVYNPSMSEINALGAWLWSSNFIDQLLKMFSDPMQAIIGVHKVFASPSVSGRSNIVVGYLDSGVASNVVGSQYTTINCGTVKLSEYFGNVFDYSPHTKVSLFLPFIGVVDLDVGEVMRASISVIYHVDVFSGACLAEVNVTRDGAAGGVLYTYSGDAAVRYPLSSGSYMGMVSGVLSVVGGIAGTIASGGSLAPALLGGAVGLGNAHTTVQHSGSISGNAGAMGGKKPYLIIRRPQTALANNFEHYSGVGANQRVTVFQMDGYFRLEDIRNVNIKGATDTEIEEIVRALEEGVLM